MEEVTWKKLLGRSDLEEVTSKKGLTFTTLLERGGKLERRGCIFGLLGYEPNPRDTNDLLHLLYEQEGRSQTHRIGRYRTCSHYVQYVEERPFYPNAGSAPYSTYVRTIFQRPFPARVTSDDDDQVTHQVTHRALTPRRIREDLSASHHFVGVLTFHAAIFFWKCCCVVDCVELARLL